MVGVFDDLESLRTSIKDAARDAALADDRTERIYWIEVDANPIYVSLTNRNSRLLASIGDATLRIRLMYKWGIFRCRATVYANNLSLSLSYDIFSGSLAGTSVLHGGTGVQHVDCTGIVGILDPIAKHFANVFVDRMARRFASDVVDFGYASSLLGLSDLVGAIRGVDLNADFEQVRSGIVAGLNGLLSRATNFEGLGVVATLVFDERSDRNFVTLRVEAPEPSAWVESRRYVAQRMRYSGNTNGWLSLSTIPSFLAVRSEVGTVASVFPSVPSGVLDRWYAVGARSKVLTSIWSEPSYYYVECWDGMARCTIDDVR